METFICQASQDAHICEKFCCYRSLINSKYIYSCKAHFSEFCMAFSVNPEKFRKLLNNDQKSDWVKSIKEKIIDIESQINKSTHKFNQFLKNIEFFYYKQVLMPLMQTKKLLKTCQANICETMTVNEEAYQILKKGRYRKQGNEVALIGSDIFNNLKGMFRDLFDIIFAEVNQRVSSNRADTIKYSMNNREIKELKYSKSALDLKLKNAEENEKKLNQKINKLKTKNNKLKNKCSEEQNNYKKLEMEYHLQAETIKDITNENENLTKLLDVKKQDDEKNKKSPEKKTNENYQTIKVDIAFTDSIDERSKKNINKRDNKFINDSLSTRRQMDLNKCKSKKPENYEKEYDKKPAGNNKTTINRIPITPIIVEKNIKLRDSIGQITPLRFGVTPTGGKQTKDSSYKNSNQHLKNRSVDKDFNHSNSKKNSLYLPNLNHKNTKGNLTQHEELLKKDISSKYISPDGSRGKFKLDELRVSSRANFFNTNEYLDHSFYVKGTRNLH